MIGAGGRGSSSEPLVADFKSIYPILPTTSANAFGPTILFQAQTGEPHFKVRFARIRSLHPMPFRSRCRQHANCLKGHGDAIEKPAAPACGGFPFGGTIEKHYQDLRDTRYLSAESRAQAALFRILPDTRASLKRFSIRCAGRMSFMR